MTSIVSIVTVFMATFLLAFGYMTYSQEAPAPDETDMPAMELSEGER